MSEYQNFETAYEAIINGLLKHGVKHTSGNDIETYSIGNVVKVQKTANERYDGDVNGGPVPFQIPLNWLFIFMQVQLELQNKR